MAYSPEQWDKARALFERGASLSEITKQSDIKDKGSISRKAKADGWVKGKMQPLVAKEVEARQTLIDVEAEKATLNATERGVHEQVVAEKLQLEKFFRNANVLAAKTVITKLQTDKTNASYAELDAASRVISRSQESALGKVPAMVINNNNDFQANVLVQQSPEDVRRWNEQLEQSC